MSNEVLYVDSDRSRFEALNTSLKDSSMDYELSWAGSGIPATMILGKDRFAAMVSHERLQDIEGLELLRRLRADGFDIPFLLVIESDDPDLEKQAMILGADAVLNQQEISDNPEHFLNTLHQAISLQDYEYQDESSIDDLRNQASFFQINPAPVLQADSSGIILNCNPAAEEVFGEKLRGTNLTLLFNGLSMYDIEVMTNFGVSQLEETVNGLTFLFTLRTDPLNNLIYLFATNITDRIQAERRLQTEHQKNELLLSSITSVLISVDETGKVNEWNTVAEDIFEIKARHAIGQQFSSLPINWSNDDFVAAIKVFNKITKAARFESLPFKLGEDEIRIIVAIVSPIKGGGYLLLADDVTEQKALEDQLSQAQKLEAIGQLAAGIAHEINTPTQYIGDNTHFINDAFQDLVGLLESVQKLIEAKDKGSDTTAPISEIKDLAEEADIEYLIEEVPMALGQSLDGIKRVTDIVRAMKEFSHPGSADMKEIDINNALQSTITVARNEWKYVAEMETNFDTSVPVIPCFPGELNQVFLNIITNASHAIGDIVGDGGNGKGKISITTVKEEEYVLIKIADSGGGIPEKIRKKVFDPFFTTKEIGKGTGQGLAISHNVIVEKHKGKLDFESVDGEGTTFLIRLPLKQTSEDEE